MKNIPGRSAALPMMLLCMAVRIFWGIAADYPEVYSASWMCPLLGFVLFLPFAFAAVRIAKLGNDSVWGNLRRLCPAALIRAAELIFVLMLVYDCATCMRLLAGTANVMALGELSVFVLLLPLGALVFISVMLGADAEGNNIRIWMRMLVLFLLVVVALHIPSFEPGWLTPVLGSGLKGIAGASIYAGGGFALLMLPWIISVPDRSKRSPLLTALLAAAAAAVLLACFQMLSPPPSGVELSRSSRTELILSNGRTALSMQFLMILLWYGALMHLIATEAVTAASFLHSMLPRAPQWLLAALLSGAGVALGSTALASPPECVDLFGYYFILMGAVLALLMLFALFRKGEAACEEC